MINFITGKPGGGKTLRVMQLLFEHLEKDTRRIITNVEIRLDEIQDYCDRNGIDVDVQDRIHHLSDEYYSYPDDKRFQKLDWLRKFYLIRGDHQFLEWAPDTDLEDHFKPLYINSETGEPTGYQGCVYIIDETRKLWPARNFQKIDGRIFDYFGLHRHFGDDVYLICQFVGQIDKQIRGYGQHFEVIRNQGKEKYSVFRGPSSFRRYVYLEVPTKGVSHVQNTTFRLNKDQANCYKTSAMGGGADKGQRAKGIPFYMFYVFVGLAAVVAYLILGEGPELLVKRGIEKGKSNVEQNVSLNAPSASSQSAPAAPVQPPQDLPVIQGHPSPVTRIMQYQGRVYVHLLDGARYTDLDDELESVIPEKGVKISGVWHYMYEAPALEMATMPGVHEQAL